jgi:four helix bundle protein
MPAFFHEKLIVYHKAIAFVVAADRVALRIPKWRLYLRYQLWRACSSIVLNIAEGASGQTAKTKWMRYRTALGSAAECSAAFDICVALGIVTEEEVPRNEIREIGAMLYALLPKRK